MDEDGIDLGRGLTYHKNGSCIWCGSSPTVRDEAHVHWCRTHQPDSAIREAFSRADALDKQLNDELSDGEVQIHEIPVYVTGCGDRTHFEVTSPGLKPETFERYEAARDRALEVSRATHLHLADYTAA